ncbi:MAG: cytochrome c [Alphaproteobacteria bacterium]
MLSYFTYFTKSLRCAFAMAMIAMCAVKSANADQAALDYGAYLAQECSSCHHQNATTIPSLAGIDRDHFIEAMMEYQAGLRTNQAMQSVAKSLGVDELNALGLWYESLK